MTAADHPVSPEDLMAYLDGELPLAQAAVVQAHVAGCDGCQRSSGELRGVSRDMSRWQVEDPPATFTAPWPPPGRQEKVASRFGWLLKPSIALVAVGAVVAVLVPLTYPRLSTQPLQMLAVSSPAAPATSRAFVSRAQQVLCDRFRTFVEVARGRISVQTRARTG